MINASPTLFPVTKYSATSSDESVLRVDGTELIAGSAGDATVICTAEHLGKYYEAQADITVVDELPYDIQSTRTATDIVIARKTDSIEVGEEFVCQAYILSSMTDEHPYPYGYSDDNLVKFTTSNPSVCRMKNGVLFGVAPGVATITASDLEGRVTDSFDITVSEPVGLEYTEEQVLEVDASAYDWSTAETTTLAIQQVLAEASAAGMRKVVFPQQLYNVSPAYGTIQVPTQMIVDFSGSIIQIQPSAMTTNGGYCMFRMLDTEYSELQNAAIYGERQLIEGTGVEGCVTFAISGTSVKSYARNCTFAWSPGFTTSFGNTNRKVSPVKLSGIVAGGLDDTGAEIEQSYAYRSDYTSVKSVGNARNRVWLGNVQGYGGYAYLSARVFDLHWYDVNKHHIGMEHHCIQYYSYDKPADAVYARIVFWQASAPTSGDPDYFAVAHLHSYDKPDRCGFICCTFEEGYSTGCAPNGGENMLFDHCVFRNNGYRDPHAAIDWEDGRQHNKGHILRYCTFSGDGGDITVIGADGLAAHNNRCDGINLGLGSEVQNSRVWLNTMIVAKIQVYPKTDCVVSQNIGWDGADIEVTEVADVGFAVRMAGNVFE